MKEKNAFKIKKKNQIKSSQISNYFQGHGVRGARLPEQHHRSAIRVGLAEPDRLESHPRSEFEEREKARSNVIVLTFI